MMADTEIQTQFVLTLQSVLAGRQFKSSQNFQWTYNDLISTDCGH